MEPVFVPDVFQCTHPSLTIHTGRGGVGGETNLPFVRLLYNEVQQGWRGESGGRIKTFKLSENFTGDEFPAQQQQGNAAAQLEERRGRAGASTPLPAAADDLGVHKETNHKIPPPLAP